jgi:hypothetical protein
VKEEEVMVVGEGRAVVAMEVARAAVGQEVEVKVGEARVAVEVKVVVGQVAGRAVEDQAGVEKVGAETGAGVEEMVVVGMVVAGVGLGMTPQPGCW